MTANPHHWPSVRECKLHTNWNTPSALTAMHKSETNRKPEHQKTLPNNRKWWASSSQRHETLSWESHCWRLLSSQRGKQKVFVWKTMQNYYKGELSPHKTEQKCEKTPWRNITTATTLSEMCQMFASDRCWCCTLLRSKEPCKFPTVSHQQHITAIYQLRKWPQGWEQQNIISKRKWWKCLWTDHTNDKNRALARLLYYQISFTRLGSKMSIKDHAHWLHGRL